MRYVALGDSISIDLYTEVVDGGAASQLSRLLQVSDFENRTFDGATTDGVLERDFGAVPVAKADCVTVTMGGNDLLGGAFARTLGDRAQGQVVLQRRGGDALELFEVPQVAAGSMSASMPNER